MTTEHLSQEDVREKEQVEHDIEDLHELGYSHAHRGRRPDRRCLQYRKRVDDFDFDIVVQRFGFSSTPGDTLRTFFTSRAATTKGSQNVGGISDPVIDALVERVIAGTDWQTPRIGSHLWGIGFRQVLPKRCLKESKVSTHPLVLMN